MSDVLTEPRTEPTAATLRLADTAWPMIHCTAEGTKQTGRPGPASPVHKVQMFEAGQPSIIMPIGRRYLYYQAAQDWIYAFDLNDIREPRYRFATEDTGYPFVGGGVIDNRGNLWWTVKNRVVRLNEELGEPVYSQPMEPADLGYNGLNLMMDGNLLATCKEAAHVICSTEDDGELRILSTTDLQEIFQLSTPSLPLITRAVDDGKGNVYMNANQTVCRLRYDAERQRLLPQPVWTFTNTQVGGQYAFADPVLVGKQLWAITTNQTLPMQLSCLDAETGALLGQCMPFPTALGASTWHTLGAAPGAGLGIVICNSGDQEGGGVVALDSQTLETVWRVPLKNVSEAFCVSQASGRVYISNKESDDAPLRFWSIALTDGAATVLYELPSDDDPPQSLPSIGYDGTLYYPTASQLVKLQAG